MRFIAGLCVAACFAVSPLWAQNTATPDTQTVAPDPIDQLTAEPRDEDPFGDAQDWSDFTNRVEAAVVAGRASNTVLGELRSDLAVWRDRFLTRTSANQSRIATVRSQIAALGSAPDGVQDDPRIVERRDVLNDQLQRLSAPAVLAQEAYTQANGLISEIDELLRDRQTERFTERSQSPLIPSGWSRAADGVGSSLAAINAEVRSAAVNPSRRAEFVDNLPAILALMALALVLVLRGRVWIGRISQGLAGHTGRMQGVVRFVLSLGQVVLPFLGLLALSSAVSMTGMAGRRLGAIFEALPLLGLFPILAHWLAGLLLPKDGETQVHQLALEPEASAKANRRFILLGYGLFALGLAQAFSTANTLDQIPNLVLVFPFGVLVAWALYRLGHVLRGTEQQAEDGAPRSFRFALRNIMSRGVMIASVAGVVFAALGYSNAIEMITVPAALTIYLLAVLMLLQRLSVDVYSLLSSKEDAAQTALLPVLVAFALIVLSLPVFAIIWGAQVTDITELWARFREGFSFGETTISPSNFLLFAIVFVVGYTVTRLIQGALRSTVLPRTKLDAGGQDAIVAGTGYIGIFLAAIIAITTAGIDLSSLAIVAGALSVGIGFGLQNIVSNFVAGIILLIERPISQGDWIEVGGQMGYVRDISVRSTRIETFDRTDVIVPNADLVSGQVTNWTRGNSVGRAIVPVGVAYGTDTEVVKSILKEIAEAHPMVLLNPGPAVIFQGFGADSLDFEIRAILRDVNYVLSVKSDMNYEIDKRFKEAGIEIPFGQRDIWLRNPEALTQGLTGAAATERKPDSKESET